MNAQLAALRIGLVFAPMCVAFNDLVLGVVPVTGDSFGVGDEKPHYGTKSYMLVNKWFGKEMRRGELQLGDLVVLTDPTNPDQRIIRKVGGLSDQWVRVNDGTGSYHVYVRKGYCWIKGRETVDLEKADRSSSSPSSSSKGDDAKKSKGEEVEGQVGEEKKAMESVMSRHDSLTFGPISMGLIIGSPLFVVGPMKRFGALNKIVEETS